MLYKKLGKTDALISIIALGGHEYLPDKRSRGFNEDFEKAITPGFIFNGFGQEKRKKVLKAAFDHGINFFDVTMDSEKEALGRNLKEIPPPYPIYVQTRPEGFVYTYDENNVKMGKYDVLKQEVYRILQLLQRERIEFLNFAFMKAALDHDPEYMDKICFNIKKLKEEGLIQYACADTFSGESTYIRQIESGCFDAVYINFNFGDDGGTRQVLPLAKKMGMGVIAREAFMKGNLFKMAKEAGIEDTHKLAQAALKWCLSFPEVTTVVYGTGNVEHLNNAIQIVDSFTLSELDKQLIELIKTTNLYKQYKETKTKEFFQL
jgi:aryl-alcohol dehydrogenase-like predicted oxidoreductase